MEQLLLGVDLLLHGQADFRGRAHVAHQVLELLQHPCHHAGIVSLSAVGWAALARNVGQPQIAYLAMVPLAVSIASVAARQMSGEAWPLVRMTSWVPRIQGDTAGLVEFLDALLLWDRLLDL